MQPRRHGKELVAASRSLDTEQSRIRGVCDCRAANVGNFSSSLPVSWGWECYGRVGAATRRGLYRKPNSSARLFGRAIHSILTARETEKCAGSSTE